jgi:uncharacterized protein
LIAIYFAMPAPASPVLTYFGGFLLFITAFVAGGLNAVAGGGSFLSFPVLIFMGVPPIIANATNTAAMWVSALATLGAYRQDFDQDRRSLFMLSVVSMVGGLLGAIFLLYSAADFFRALIPYLLLLATTLFIFGESLKQWLQSQRKKAYSKSSQFLYLLIVQLVISIYGGFFGAGAGILMLAALTFFDVKNIHSMNALKMLLGTCINGVAVVLFIFAGLVAWPQALLMAVGGSLGGYAIAQFSRKITPNIIRQFVSAVAVGMTIYFFVRG